MWCLSLLFLFYGRCGSQFPTATPLRLPPPVSVTCSKAPTRVYQQQDHEFQISCLWDGAIEMRYSRGPGVDSEKEKADSQPPPTCNWYRDSIFLNNTRKWSGLVELGPALPGEVTYPSWDHSQITIQCVSALCTPPLCLHHNLSIEMTGQDVHLFSLRRSTLPIFEWQWVPLSWCARLKSSTWNYHFRSQGGHPAELLIPSNQHSEPPPLTVFPNVELYQVCATYYSYQLTVRYPHRGFYIASLSVEHGPPISLSMDLLVEPALLHVFSGHSKLLSCPHGTLSLSWSLLQLSQGIVAYQLVDRAGVAGWSHSYSYNPFALRSNFCAGPKSHHSEEKVLASIYFRTNEIMSGGLTGKLDFSDGTLVFTANSTRSFHLTLNPQKIKVGTYIFSHSLGLYYSSQEGSATNATGESSSSHYIFYQQQSLSYLIVVEFVQQQWYRFRLHMYLNRREALFKALGEKGIEVHVFSGQSPDESLAYIVWFIPVQHPLLQCEWAFSLQLFDPKNQYPLQNYTFAYTDHVRNAAQFIPDSVLPFHPAAYTGFVAQVKCTSSGIVSTVLKTTVNIYASKTIKSKVACLEKPCTVSEVHIQRIFPSKVLHFAHGTEFSLVAETRINCPGPKQTDVIWNIYKVPNTTTPPDWSTPFQPPGVGRRNVTILDVPGFSLDDGLYLFNFTVKLIPMDKRNSTEKSASLFVEIGSDNLVAVISGGPFQEIGFSDRLVLDGTGSLNAGSVPPTEGITFTWYCTKQKMDYVTMTLSEEGKCRPNQVDLKWTTSSHPIQMIQPKTLQDNTVYYFRLVVQNGYRIAQAEQVIHVQPDSAPVLNVTCIENCGRSVIPNERFCLSGKCLNCRTRKTLYYWSLLSVHSAEVRFDWASKSTTGRSSPYLRINAFAFSSMADQSYILRLKVITREGQSAVYEHFFDIHNPPRKGTCVLNPRVGVAFLTKFVIDCSGFEDQNGPLTYKVIAASDQVKMSTISSVENSTLGIIVYTGHEHRTPQSFLPAGTPSQDSALIIYVQVCDALGACSQVNLQATVHYQMKSKSTDVVHRELRGLVNEPRSPMTALLLTKDYFNLGYFIYMVASELNNIEVSPINQGFKADLRKVLLNMVTGIPSADLQEINQVILSICRITQEITEVNQESQLLAVRKLKEVSDALRRHRDKGLGSKETEVFGHGILIGLSNVLRASLLKQRNANIDAVKETISVMEKLADLVLQGKVPGEQETNMKTKDWIIYLWKDENWEVSGSSSERRPCKNCFYPKLKHGDPAELPADAVVSTVLYEFGQNPFPWLPHTADISTAVMGFQMRGTKSNGDIIRIVPDVTEMVMARKDEDLASFALTVGPDKKLPKTTGGFSFVVKRSSKDILIQIISKIKITFHVFIYLNISHPPVAFYTASHDSPPTPKKVGPEITDCAVKAPYIICLSQSFLWSSTQADKSADTWNITVVLQMHPIVSHQTTSVVRIAVFAADCLELDGVQNQWKEGTCRLGSQTSYSKIHCVCKPNKYSKRTAGPQSTGLSRSGIRFMASKIYLFSKPVDLKIQLLLESGQNLLPVWTVVTIFISFIILAIWAIRKDRSVVIRDPIINLPDNDPFHNIRYLVTIYTGNCCGAGTGADVFIQLIGQAGTSDVHQLNYPQFPKILQRASTDTFLLTTKEDLGDIFSLHIWHNNSGYFSAWYLSRVKVHNMATQKFWLFMCRKWLAIGHDDCQIERTFTAIDPAAPLKRMDYFLISVANDLFKDHLWLSLFARETDGPFSKFQRVSCCFTILLSLLMINTLLIVYKFEGHAIKIRYSKALLHGLESTFFSLPLQLSVISLFKYSHEKPSQQGSVGNEGNEGNSGGTVPSEVKSQTSPSADTNSSQKNEAKKMFFVKTRRIRLCWWCTYVAWIFVFILSAMASFLTIFYGLSYTYRTSIEWLISCSVSACQHIFIQQTLKTVWLSAFGSICAKDCENIPWSHYKDKKLNDRTMSANEMEQLHNRLVQLRASKKYEPLAEEEVAIMRKTHKVKYRAYMFMKDMLCHFVFLALILIWSDSSETTSSFYYNQLIRNKFSAGLSKVDKAEDIYTWTRDVFLPLIHNDFQPTFISETWSKILGLPRMRQIRAKNTKRDCTLSHLTPTVVNETHCHHKYGIDPEDQADYLGSWTVPANHPVSRTYSGFLGFTYEHSPKDWDYDSHGELYNYPARGYSLYFFPEEPEVNSTKRLADLETNQWIDDQSWAVILELTAFNPDVDLFCSISVIFEFSYLGFINRSLTVHSYKLPIFTHQTKMQFFVFVVIILMLLIYIVDECWILHQEKSNYFKAAANLINFGLKTICVLVLLLHIAKFMVAVKVVQYYLHNSEQFVPFHKVSNLDQFVKKTIGFLVFFLVLKTYRYFRFLHDVRLAQKTLFSALPTLLNLSIAGGIFFFAFVSFGYLVFGQHEWNYRTMVYSFTTILSYCTMAFRHTQFATAKSLAGFFLAGFMLVMVCIVVNLSHVIFISAYTEMKELGSKEPSHEAETMYLVIQKIYKMWFSAIYGTQPKTEIDIFNTVLYGKPTRKYNLEYMYRKMNRNRLKSPQISDKNLV